MSTTADTAEVSATRQYLPAPDDEIRPGKVYLTEEAARLIRVEVSTIQRFVRTGVIRGRGRPFRILGSELLKLV